MKMFTAELEDQLREVFQDLVDDVTIAYFGDGDCYTCSETESYMEEVEALNDKIHLKKYELKTDVAEAAKYNVTMAPSIVILDSKGEYRGIKFNGIPGGHEINSFIPALLEVSGAGNSLPKDVMDRIEAIDKPVNIKVFITLSCPHCPGAVHTAHKLALLNSNVEAEMIEAQTFDELSNRFNVSAVPKIVFNDDKELLGNQPIQQFLSTIEAM
ncbi:MAG: thioredoxin family protein [Bacillota bacterium]